MVRLPKDPENWSGWHADKCIEDAWRLFKQYDQRVDFDKPREEQDALYRPYQLARQLAVDVANYTSWRRREAEALP
jgi:hypothetical protein